MYVCLFFLVFILVICFFLLLYNFIEPFNEQITPKIIIPSETLEKPYLWLYWESIENEKIPDYINLCYESVLKHCSNSFNIVRLDEKSILNYLPEISDMNLQLNDLLIAQKVDFYRVCLLYKYGGLYIDADTLVMRDPIEIIDKTNYYDYVGFGCTGEKCNYGYGKPSNGIMASRPQGKLMSKVLDNLIKKLTVERKRWDYFDLGKFIIWEELEKLMKNDNYQYYHYTNDYDGTRDIDGNWIETSYLFTNKPIRYKNPENLIFIILYNSQMKELKNLSRDEILNSNVNISTFIKKSLDL
ncbi:capsular polysaccharide synthesis protein [Catovirus CTV1]|uniref:Capsular polysaccharide synthesis protein n=1 Tax=Catovirus CTV1 TaxID=1977631 RepID=A0A1V0SBK4_9VIRU|nr:capsular polysaccharide synthesis protein [Catovirus CTV1]